MSSPFRAVPGAVVDDDGILLHVGSPMREQRDLAEGASIAPLGDRVVLTVAGEDRLSWLDSLASQSLAGLPAGVSTELLILDPQGHVEHAAAVVDDGECTWLIVDRDDAEALLAWLMRMRFRLRVDPRDASPEYAVVGGTASAVADLPAAVSWTDPWPAVSVGGWGYSPVEPHPGVERDWVEAVVPVAELDRIAGEAVTGGLRVSGTWAAEALRVAAWRPRRSAEADGRTLPHEADWMRTAVHLSKGCYRGQETVARVHNLGRPPRRLVLLNLDGSADRLPETGDPVTLANGRAVGRVGSVAYHHEDGPIALALVKRTVDASTALLAGPVDAAVDPDDVADDAAGTPLSAIDHRAFRSVARG